MMHTAGFSGSGAVAMIKTTAGNGKKRRTTNSMTASSLMVTIVVNALAFFTGRENNTGNKLQVQSPPWTFQVRRIHYQFRTVPVETARKSLEAVPLPLLSLLGYTLGGLFVIEYEESPVGPYQEVAVLSGLVARPRDLCIGAWASHIFVDSDDAATYAREFWGLPATVVHIDFTCGEGEDQGAKSRSKSSKGPSFSFRRNKVEVKGPWGNEAFPSKSDTGNSITYAKTIPFLDITLPSFSGCLSENSKDKSKQDPVSPLLRYPLRIFNVGQFSITGAEGKLSCKFDDLLDELLLGGGKGLFAITLQNVRLTAGAPTTVVD